MPQSTAALRQKAEALRFLTRPQYTGEAAQPGQPQGAALARPVLAKRPFACPQGTCLALDVRPGKHAPALWVLVRDTHGVEGWAPIARILPMSARKAWAREGFG